MKNPPNQTEGQKSRSAGALPALRLCRPGRSLCRLTGYGEEELQREERYAALVHPADRQSYASFVEGLRAGEGSYTADYRLVRKDGSTLWVRDTVAVGWLPDGTLQGEAVLTDITDLKEENRSLRFLRDAVPVGFLRCTCQKQPKITYMNQQMLELLRFPQVRAGELDYLELYRENIFLMIPMEERRRFALYLNRVHTAGEAIAGEMTLLRCDGSKAYVLGWVAKTVGEDGQEEFQGVCMDITQRQQAREAGETSRYLRALSEVFDKIFEYNLGSATVKCLYGSDSPVFQRLENIPMQMESATEKWIGDTVVLEDRERVLAFFRVFFRGELEQPGGRPPQITYRARSTKGGLRFYTGIFLQMEERVSLYCCRCVPGEGEAELLRSENLSLRDSMQKLMLRFTDGAAAFQVADGMVTPLYASDNVCGFFGFTREEWLPLMEKSTPIREFIAHSQASEQDFMELLRDGEAEFSYLDLGSGARRRIRAVCSQRAPGGATPRYIMLYNVEEALPPEEGNALASIRTFGYFDVFVGGRPIAFRNKKSKELFALLVDRRGGYITSEEAIAFLWEDEETSPVTLARYRKVALRLKNLLEEYGIPEVMESVDGKRRVVPERVRCDLYDYLSGREEYAQLFKGSYLTNYSWGENTLAELQLARQRV